MEKISWYSLKLYACAVVHNKRWMEIYKSSKYSYDQYEEASDEFLKSLGMLRAVADVCNFDLECLYKAAAVQIHYIYAKHPLETDGVAMFKRAYENAVLNKKLDRIQNHWISQNIGLCPGMTWLMRHAYEQKYGTSYKEVTK